MSDEPTTARPGPSPRTLLAFLGVIMGAQAVYVGVDVFGASSQAGTAFESIHTAGFVVYVAMIVAFAFAIWRETWWAWQLAVAIAATGLGLAAIRIANGDSFEGQALGMIIDGVLLFYLQRPSIKALFGR